ncbi:MULTISPECIES: twin-arginine translocase subunit TatC [Christiangramia]|uniref:Sec-independent protein translocase protein TatC n=1 Tax=Christiangramia flava JLT2011 TaxID=1229726 RepID=A0A1L7I7H5_9FLAO|nr:twin-arginine translocase subunit TatC [Christiangramia flava]APU69143.1 Twin-arginine translocation protein TatC [Christiangramia flava JLT2011]MAM18519.1 twin-arginine translocase subunit TatC [Christiangramia sp.]OSS38256.1 Twin-arginine translocation protein TatC [Christiangramia flava JLT2011]
MKQLPPQEVEGGEMSFLDHLEELRWHIIRAVLAIVIAATVAFILKSFIFDVLLFGPSHPDFFSYRILCKMSGFFGIEGGFCDQEMPFRIQSRTMGGQFSAHVWTSITAGFIIAFPFVIYEFWKFVAPAMHTHEKKYARGFIFVTSFLFFLGVLFGYYIVTPLSINFLGKYQVSDMVFNDFDLSSYISLVRASVLASGLIFELPILIYFLTKVGVVTPQFLKTYRKYALVVVLVVSAIITPPDIVSQIIVAIPVLILYEVSIIISSIMYKREQKKVK